VLLERSVERHLEAVDDLGSVLQMLPLGDLRTELTLMARWNLGARPAPGEAAQPALTAWSIGPSLKSSPGCVDASATPARTSPTSTPSR
jgi:hypothetical protein